jgi:hypothetical protein
MNRFTEKLLSSRLGQYSALVFTIYAGIWTIIEPLNLTWINSHSILWRTILVTGAILLSLILSIQVASRKLEMIDADGPGKPLLNPSQKIGLPTISLTADGNLGNVVIIKGDYNTEAIDWQLRSSGQRAGKIEFIFTHTGTVRFYIRIIVVSKTGDAVMFKWIRFDNTVGRPDKYEEQEEMACPYDSTNTGNFLKVNIDILKAVKDTFGQGGWEYEKTMTFRIRGEATIKSISFRK